MTTAAYNPTELNKLFELDTQSSEAVAAQAASDAVAAPADELNKLFNLASVEEPLTTVAASKDLSKEILEFFQGSFKDSMGVTLLAKNYAFSIEELAKHMKVKDTFSVAQSLVDLVKKGKIKKVNKKYEYTSSSVAAKAEEPQSLKKGKTYTVYMHDPRDNEYAYLQGYYEAKDGESLEAFKKRIGGRMWDTCFVFDSPVDKRASKTAAQVNIKDPTLTVQEAAQALELSIFRPETLRDEPTQPEDPSTVVYVLDYYGPQDEQIHREFSTPEERQTYMTEHQPEISRPSLTTVLSNAAAAMSPTDELNQILL